MEQNEYGKVGVGTKDTISLKPAKVKILGYKVEMQKDKTGKDIEKKVVVTCKHPDKPENIEISSASYKKVKEIKQSGLWFKLDDDNMIPKSSALASFLKSLNANNLDEITGKDADTELDDAGYLCFKAY